MTVSSEGQVLSEPKLVFRYDQQLVDPHHGLSLFGPWDVDLSSHPKSMAYAVVGTQRGIDLCAKWIARVNKAILSPKGMSRFIWPTFPGVEAAFHSSCNENPVWSGQLQKDLLSRAARIKDPNKRCYEVVNQYVSQLKTIEKRDEYCPVIICVVPDEVYLNCRPKSRVSNGIGNQVSAMESRKRKLGELDLFDTFDPEQYDYSVDFRRQLKGRAMEYGTPIQIIRESTIASTESPISLKRGLTPQSDIAWNLMTTFFYKAGGRPWKLASARDGTCYVGLAFKKSVEALDNRTACCAAQMFLDTGDGIVFLGDEGKWYSPEDRQFHLTQEAAYNLLRGIIDTYKSLDGGPLKEIFLHSRSTINNEEYAGYRAACPKDVQLVGVRVRTQRRAVKLFRQGKWPVLRGTFWPVDKRKAFLWASGFKPGLRTYDGWEIPLPLEITVQHGDADIQGVSKDILSLTKLNYNCCKSGDSQPVTVLFSDAVGEILVSNPRMKKQEPRFKFYI